MKVKSLRDFESSFFVIFGSLQTSPLSNSVRNLLGVAVVICSEYLMNNFCPYDSIIYAAIVGGRYLSLCSVIFQYFYLQVVAKYLDWLEFCERRLPAF